MRNVLLLLGALTFTFPQSALSTGHSQPPDIPDLTDAQVDLGPEKFRANRRRRAESIEFEISNLNRDFYLEVSNGKTFKPKNCTGLKRWKKFKCKAKNAIRYLKVLKSRVRSGKIWVNDELVADSSQFGLFTSKIIVPIELESENELTVRLLSPRRGQISIRILSIEPSTGLLGRVVDANDLANGITTPIVGATISLLGTTYVTTTGSDGFFLLEDIPSGTSVFDINAATAQPGPGGVFYASFREALPIEPGHNEITRPFSLPRIDVTSTTQVDPNQTTIVENTNLGVRMEIAPGAAKHPDGSLYTGTITISEVPRGFAPAALPEFLDPRLLITIQPVGVEFDPPAAIAFPNIDGLPDGTDTEIWSLDPNLGQFAVVGFAEVSGNEVATFAGGIQRTDWHLSLPPEPPGDDNDNDGEDHDDKLGKCEGNKWGSSNTLQSGELEDTHQLVSYQSLGETRGVTLRYGSLRANPNTIISRIIPFPTQVARSCQACNLDNTPLDWFPPQFISYEVQVNDVSIGETIYRGNINNDVRGESGVFSQHLNASNLATGVYPVTNTVSHHWGEFFSVTQIFDPTQYSTRKEITTETIVIRNESSSPFGAGWTLEELEQLHFQSDGSILLTQGDGTHLIFLGGGDGLKMEMFDGFFFLDELDSETPLPFDVTGDGYFSTTTEFTIPVINFSDESGFAENAFYNVGPNGYIDPTSSPTTPKGDDLSIQPPNGNDFLVQG